MNYISQDEAQNSGLFNTDNGTVFMGVDSTNVASGRGRNSIRISSQKTYTHGLIILDLAHMPAGACGTWPAFWLLGANWPNDGEVDIIEGVNSATTNNMAMHTDSGCSITNTGAFSGIMETDNCDVNAPNQDTNAGCSIRSTNSETFGDGFNSIGGGVYATEWTSSAINIWFFPRKSIPSDISSGSPNPDNWGLPIGQFAGGCDIDEHVFGQQIVFDVTFCGDWAGGVWSTDSVCSPKASTCQDYVQNTPDAFKDTYWSINSLQVFQDNGAAAPSASASTSYSSTTSTTTTGTVTSTVTSTTAGTATAVSSSEGSFPIPTFRSTTLSTIVYGSTGGPSQPISTGTSAPVITDTLTATTATPMQTAAPSPSNGNGQNGQTAAASASAAGNSQSWGGFGNTNNNNDWTGRSGAGGGRWGGRRL